jgi:site-specific DNA-cytosine methylase
VDTTQELTHISLCTGYGGIDLGLGRALGAVRSIAYVEIEAFPVINLVKKIEAGFMDSAPIFTNLKVFPWRLYHQKVDILSGGFPCQPFSTAGQRTGDEDPRHLWPYIVRGIRELGRPPIVFFENVEGIISSKLTGDGWRDRQGTSVLLHVLRELERLGYKSTAGTFSAAEVGAPHQRNRVFILGIRNDLKKCGFENIKARLKDEIKTAFPRGAGEECYKWEPPRVTLAHSNDKRLQRRRKHKTAEANEGRDRKIKFATKATLRNRKLQRKIEHTMGRRLNGSTDWVDFSKLCESYDHRDDELRMLGNGVVPDTAARAFRILFNKLAESQAAR